MWKVTLTRRAERQFGQLPDNVQRDCVSALEDLADGSGFGERLRKHERFERVKFHSGGYRIIYRMNQRAGSILVSRIAKRDSKTYKGFNPV